MTPCEKRRRALGWSQEQLAARAKVCLSTVRSLEDAKDLRVSSLRKIAKALRADPGDLINEKAS